MYEKKNIEIKCNCRVPGNLTGMKIYCLGVDFHKRNHLYRFVKILSKYDLRQIHFIFLLTESFLFHFCKRPNIPEVTVISPSDGG